MTGIEDKTFGSSAENVCIVAQAIVPEDLCAGCGACAAVCPAGALKMDHPRSYKPVHEESRCIRCGACYQVCPGKGWPAVKWANELCRSGGAAMHPRYGPVRRFFLGVSTDPEVHLKGASGGVATGLLLYLLDTKQIDAAAVVALENGYPVVKITDNPADIISSAGSKYSPVPLMHHVIRDLKNHPRRIAMTVTPCQMAAFRYASEKDRTLAENLILAIGLFCGDVKDYESVTRIADTMGIRCSEEARFLGWRCGPWPGNARFELADGSIKDKPLHPWLGISIPYYALHRCLMCPSRENWLADLALADNHVGKTSETIIVARTERGEKKLRCAAEAGFLKLTEMKGQQAEELVTCDKFAPALSYMSWRRKNRLPVPLYDYDEKKYLTAKKIALYLHLVKYRLFIIARNRKILGFLIARPSLLEKTGRFLNTFPDSVPGNKVMRRLAATIFRPFEKAKRLPGQ